jgi:shikimate dehydrogenase
MITGKTRLYGIIGDPIAHVRSPEIYSSHFVEQGIDAVLVPMHIPQARFDRTIEGLLNLENLDGLLVTLPYKSRLVSHASRLGATAQMVDSVNALRREADGTWTGDMFDGAGMVRGIERKGHSLRGRKALLLGCGGAGSAIAVELATAGVSTLRIVDTNKEKAQALVEVLRRSFPGCDIEVGEADMTGRDLVVNATPVGMKPSDGLPAPLGRLNSNVLVADVILSGDRLTALVEHARQCGCTTFDGRDMHSGQVEAILDFFRLRRNP